jgi:hypothetical protein
MGLHKDYLTYYNNHVCGNMFQRLSKWGDEERAMDNHLRNSRPSSSATSCVTLKVFKNRALRRIVRPEGEEEKSS